MLNASMVIANPLPIDLAVPPLAFDLLLPNCAPEDPPIKVAEVHTRVIAIRPKLPVEVDLGTFVRRLPDLLIQACPNSNTSPLDGLLAGYLHHGAMTVYVRGSASQSEKTPPWLARLISSVTIPVPYVGHRMDHLMRNFSLANVHFSLPDPFADPHSPQSQSTVSATVKVWIALPEEVGIPIDVDRVRADADIYYHHRKLGNLDLRRWQPANATRIEAHGEEGPILLVESLVEHAPLNVTDSDLFSQLVQDLIFGSKPITLQVKANVAVDVGTVLGQFVIKDIPAQGNVVVNRS